MAVGTIAASAISAGITIYQGAKAKEAAYDNADLLEKEGAEIKKQAGLAANDLQADGVSFMGTQRTGIAKSGIKANVGSPLQMLKQSQENINKDVNNLRTQGTNAQSKIQKQADSLRGQGDDALTTSIISGGTSFATNLMSTGMDYNWWGPGHIKKEPKKEKEQGTGKLWSEQ